MTLTTRERVYRFIVDYKRKHDGCAPTLQEIADSAYIGKTVALHHVRALEKLGLIGVLGIRCIIIKGGTWHHDDQSGPADFAVTRSRRK